LVEVCESANLNDQTLANIIRKQVGTTIFKELITIKKKKNYWKQ